MMGVEVLGFWGASGFFGDDEASQNTFGQEASRFANATCQSCAAVVVSTQDTP